METDAALAERIVLGALAKERWREIDLKRQSEGHRMKVRIARHLRMQTPMNRQWIADRFRMGRPVMSPLYWLVSIVSSGVALI